MTSSERRHDDRGVNPATDPPVSPAPRTAPYRQVVTRPVLHVPGDALPWFPRPYPGAPPIPAEFVRAAAVPLDRAGLLQQAPISAVLVPILEREGDAHVLLTRRSSRLSLDPGNISFPGGHLEPGEHPLDAALREAEEEIGLAPADVEIVGSLDLVERLRDHQRVASVVGLVRGNPELSASESEVEAILEVPLSALLAEGSAWEEHWGETRRAVRFFTHETALGDDLVWGLTARILWDLLERVARQLR
jgi:8-oxo-dGTP pyrophosphatase MutT (NUDIX family)